MYKRLETCIHLLYELMVLVKAQKYRDSEIDTKVDNKLTQLGRS
jgi:hypothetical protein